MNISSVRGAELTCYKLIRSHSLESRGLFAPLDCAFYVSQWMNITKSECSFSKISCTEKPPTSEWWWATDSDGFIVNLGGEDLINTGLCGFCEQLRAPSSPTRCAFDALCLFWFPLNQQPALNSLPKSGTLPVITADWLKLFYYDAKCQNKKEKHEALRWFYEDCSLIMKYRTNKDAIGQRRASMARSCGANCRLMAVKWFST